MPLVAHVSPCGRLLNERGWACAGEEGRWHRPVKWTFNYLPWLNTTQSERTEHSSPLFLFLFLLIAPPIAASHVVCLFFGGCRWNRTRREAGTGSRSATALPASYSNYLSYRRFDFHAARPSWVPENQSPNRMQHAARSQHFWQLTVASATWRRGAGAGAERMWGWESPVVCL